MIKMMNMITRMVMATTRVVTEEDKMMITMVAMGVVVNKISIQALLRPISSDIHR